jgi:serine/threonine protein kinase
MTCQAGSTIGTYVIDYLLGRGTSGDVYRARDRQLGRAVALKVLSPDLAAHGEHFARFRREARTGALLNHPNIAHVFDVGCERGIPFVASELLHGTTLRTLMNEGPLPIHVGVRYAADMANGLAAAHDIGVSHRDLTPENIFITHAGEVKILDFGLAKSWFESLEVFQADATHSMPATAVIGALAYLSPEQVRGEEADDRSDIFSLGVIAYEMLRGVLPFTRATPIETLQAIVNDAPGLPAGTRRISPGLDRVIRRCLAKERAQRFQSMRDVRFNFEASVTDAGDGQTPPPASRGSESDADREVELARGLVAAWSRRLPVLRAEVPVDPLHGRLGERVEGQERRVRARGLDGRVEAVDPVQVEDVVHHAAEEHLHFRRAR